MSYCIFTSKVRSATPTTAGNVQRYGPLRLTELEDNEFMYIEIVAAASLSCRCAIVVLLQLFRRRLTDGDDYRTTQFTAS